MATPYSVPRVGLGLFLLSPSQKFLLGRRLGTSTTGRDTYGLPGGHLELHESFEAGAVRELREETGIVIPEKDVRFLTAANLVRMEGKHFVSLFMGARVGEGVVPKVMEPDKCLSWEWVSWDECMHDTQKLLELRRKLNDPRARLPDGEGRNLFEAFVSLVQQRPGFTLKDYL